MEDYSRYGLFAKILVSTGMEKQLAMVLTLTFKNKPDRMDKAVDFIEKNQNLTSDQIAREVLRIAMTKKI